MTGAVEAVVVDVQCIFPALADLSACYHTKFISTSPKAKFPGAVHMEFRLCHAPSVVGLSRALGSGAMTNLTIGRVVVHYNSGSLSRRLPELAAYAPGVWVAVHPQDAERLGIRDGETVRVRSLRGEVEARVQVSDRVRPGLVFLPFHFPGVNALTMKELDREARIPSYKVAACTLERVAAPAEEG